MQEFGLANTLSKHNMYSNVKLDMQEFGLANTLSKQNMFSNVTCLRFTEYRKHVMKYQSTLGGP
jgi:hypothetical protein